MRQEARGWREYERSLLVAVLPDPLAGSCCSLAPSGAIMPRTTDRRGASRGRYDRTAHRLREIERIIQHRYGVLPDTDDANTAVRRWRVNTARRG
jgi:hypothetical protein